MVVLDLTPTLDQHGAKPKKRNRREQAPGINSPNRPTPESGVKKTPRNRRRPVVIASFSPLVGMVLGPKFPRMGKY